MKLSIQILRNAIKKFDQYLEENGLTIEEEIERLKENGQIIKPDTRPSPKKEYEEIGLP